MSPPMISKAAARYTGAGGKEHCSLCRHFSPRRGGRCARVLGDISPMGWCKLFSREIRALIADVPFVAGGGGPVPALSLDFMTPGTLSPLLTFTRASTATYFDAAGVMQSAAINAPRWDYDPATLALRGLLLEDQRTNGVRNSTMVGATVGTPGTYPNAWSLMNLGGLSTNVVAVGADANGLQYIDLQLTGTSPGGTWRMAFENLNIVASTQNQVWTTSGYVRLVSGSLTGLSIPVAGHIAYTSGGASLLTHEVAVSPPTSASLVSQRFAATATASDATVAFVRPTYSFTVAAATINATIRIACPQIELGDFATSYIPTTAAAVTRSIDSCLIPPANMAPWFVAPGGSWFAEFRYFDSTPSANPRVIGRSDLGSGGATPLFLGPTNQIGEFEPSAPAVTSATVSSANTVVKAVSSWAPGQMKICVGGGAVATGATTVAGFGIFTTSGVSLMSNPITPPANNYTSGHLRAVRYWPTVLSDASMQAMTAP